MARKDEIDFDFDALEAELYSGLAKAFTSLQLDFPEERFYNFTLYVSSELSYLGIAANTEDGLDASARRTRVEYPRYAKVGFDDFKAYIRHEFGGFAFSPHGHDTIAHDTITYDAMIEKAGKLLSEFAQETNELFNHHYDRFQRNFDAAWEIVEPLYDRVLDVCERAMRHLDKDKVFELNSPRDNVILMVRHGDSDADPEIVRRLNPDSVYVHFLKNEDVAQRASQVIHGY